MPAPHGYNHKIRCEICKRAMQPGDEYRLVNGQIVCLSPACKILAQVRGSRKPALVTSA